AGWSGLKKIYPKSVMVLHVSKLGGFFNKKQKHVLSSSFPFSSFLLQSLFISLLFYSSFPSSPLFFLLSSLSSLSAFPNFSFSITLPSLPPRNVCVCVC